MGVGCVNQVLWGLSTPTLGNQTEGRKPDEGRVAAGHLLAGVTLFASTQTELTVLRRRASRYAVHRGQPPPRPSGYRGRCGLIERQRSALAREGTEAKARAINVIAVRSSEA
jgi:hypothetical protein